MRTVVVAVLLTLAVPTVWAQRPVVSPSGYGRQLFPGGGPPGTGGGGGFGRAIAPSGVIGSGVGPGFPAYPGVLANPRVPAVGRIGTALPAYSFPIVIPGQVWPTPGYPGFASYPYANGGNYGYDPPQAQFVNNYTPQTNYGVGNGQPDQQQPVVIVNQYFRPDQASASPADAATPQTTTLAPRPATRAAPATANNPDQPYFLIAMKDTTIYAASSYWVEANTLNYITLQGNQNQVSMDLVDRDLSRRLNRERSVAFGLPSQ